jgi:hypothetical protein
MAVQLVTLYHWVSNLVKFDLWLEPTTGTYTTTDYLVHYGRVEDHSMDYSTTDTRGKNLYSTAQRIGPYLSNWTEPIPHITDGKEKMMEPRRGKLWAQITIGMSFSPDLRNRQCRNANKTCRSGIRTSIWKFKPYKNDIAEIGMVQQRSYTTPRPAGLAEGRKYPCVQSQLPWL